MRNKAFVDNDDFVVVFKNCSDEFKRYLINQYDLDLIGDFDAKPVNDITPNKANQSNDFNAPINNNVNNNHFNEEIQRTFNKHLSIIQNSSAYDLAICDDSIGVLSSFIVSGDVSLNNQSRDVINNYLINRFKGINPKDSAEMLNMIQCDNFVKIFGNAMYRVFIENNITQKSFTGLNVEEKRRYIEEGIRFFQTYNAF